MVRETLVSKYLLPSVLNIVFLDMKQENKYLLVQRERSIIPFCKMVVKEM